jgi:hypothetical protein
MSDPFEQPPPLLREPPPPIRWRSWPVRDHASRGLVVGVGLLIAAVGVGWASGKAYLGLLALAALAMALWRFFLPVVFELSEEGVDQRLFGRQYRIPWPAIKRYEVHSTGVLLLPREDHSPMASFRGLYLPWTTHRGEVLAHVRYYLDRPERAEESVAEHGSV